MLEDITILRHLPLQAPRIVFAGLGMRVYYQGANRG